VEEAEPDGIEQRRRGDSREHAALRYQGANVLRSEGICPTSAGWWRSINDCIVCSFSQSMPNGVYTSGRKSSVKNRSLLSRRDAIRTKTRNAVSLNPKP